MALAYQKLLRPATGQERPADSDVSPSRLNVSVVFTSADATIRALKHAEELADRLNARISLLVPQVVPYGFPLASPPVLLDFSERRFAEIAKESLVETTVQIYLCRDREEMLPTVLAPGSLVVIGGRKRWFRNPEKHLARKLRRVGHEVILTEME